MKQLHFRHLSNFVAWQDMGMEVITHLKGA